MVIGQASADLGSVKCVVRLELVGTRRNVLSPWKLAQSGLHRLLRAFYHSGGVLRSQLAVVANLRLVLWLIPYHTENTTEIGYIHIIVRQFRFCALDLPKLGGGTCWVEG